MDFKNNIRLGVSVDPLSSVETKVNEIVEKLSNKKITLDISFKDSSVADQLKTLTKLVDDFKEKLGDVSIGDMSKSIDTATASVEKLKRELSTIDFEQAQAKLIDEFGASSGLNSAKGFTEKFKQTIIDGLKNMDVDSVLQNITKLTNDNIAQMSKDRTQAMIKEEMDMYKGFLEGTALTQSKASNAKKGDMVASGMSLSLKGMSFTEQELRDIKQNFGNYIKVDDSSFLHIDNIMGELIDKAKLFGISMTEDMNESQKVLAFSEAIAKYKDLKKGKGVNNDLTSEEEAGWLEQSNKAVMNLIESFDKLDKKKQLYNELMSADNSTVQATNAKVEANNKEVESVQKLNQAYKDGMELKQAVTKTENQTTTTTTSSGGIGKTNSVTKTEFTDGIRENPADINKENINYAKIEEAKRKLIQAQTELNELESRGLVNVEKLATASGNVDFLTKNNFANLSNGTYGDADLKNLLDDIKQLKSNEGTIVEYTQKFNTLEQTLNNLKSPKFSGLVNETSLNQLSEQLNKAKNDLNGFSGTNTNGLKLQFDGLKQSISNFNKDTTEAYANVTKLAQEDKQLNNAEFIADQKSAYKELNTLLEQQYAIKKQLLTADGESKKLLESNLIDNVQASRNKGNYINSNGLTSETRQIELEQKELTLINDLNKAKAQLVDKNVASQLKQEEEEARVYQKQLEYLKQINTLKSNGILNSKDISQVETMVTSMTKLSQMHEVGGAISDLTKKESGIASLNKQIESTLLDLNKMKIILGDSLPLGFFESTKSSLNGLKEQLKTIEGTNLNGIRDQFNSLGLSIKGVKNDTSSSGGGFFSGVTEFLGKTGLFYGTIQVVQELQQQFQEAGKWVKYLDDSFTDMQVTMNISEGQFEKMSGAIDDMAIKLGVNAKDVHDIARVYANASATTDNILSKVAPEAMLSNVSGIHGDEMTKTVQATTYAFDLLNKTESNAGEVTQHIGDVMVKVSQNMKYDFQAGIQQLNSAIKTSGSVARESGMSLEQYTAYMGAMIERTGKTGEELGTFWKMLTARVDQVKGVGDEMGVTAQDMGKAETALNDLGIKVREENGGMKDMDTILQQLSGQWGGLSAQQRNHTAEMVAGNRHRATFLSLMKSMSTEQILYNDAMNSTGALEEANTKKAESLQGRLNTLKDTVQVLYASLLNSSMLKGGVSGLTAFISGINSAIRTVGAMPTVLTTVATAVTLFNSKFRENVNLLAGSVIPGYNNFQVHLNNLKTKLSESAKIQAQNITVTRNGITAMQSAGQSTRGMASELAGMEARLLATRAGMVALSVASVALSTALTAGLSLAISFGIQKIMDLVNAQENLKQSNEEYVQSLEQKNPVDNQAQLDAYKKLQDELSKCKAGSEQYREKEQELKEAEEALIELYPSANSALDANTGKKKLDVEATQKLIDKEKELARAKATKVLSDNGVKDIPNDVAKASEAYAKFSEDMKKYTEMKLNGQNTIEEETVGAYGTKMTKSIDIQDEIDKNTQATEQYKTKLLALKTALEELNDDSGRYDDEIKTINSALGLNTSATNENTSAKEKNKNTSTSSSKEVADEQAKANAIANATKEYDSSTMAMAKAQQYLDKLNKASVITPTLAKQMTKEYGNTAETLHSVSDAQAFLTKQIEEQKQTQAEAYEVMKGDDEAFYQEKIANNESFKNAYNNLLNSFLTDGEQAYNVDFGNYKTLNQLKQGTQNDLGVAITNWLSQFVDNSSGAYNIDFSNFKSFAQAKAKILEQLQNDIKMVTDQMNNAIASAKKYADQVANGDTSESGMSADGTKFEMTENEARRRATANANYADHLADKLGNLNTAYQKVNTSFDQFQGSMNSFNGGIGGNTDIGSGNSGGSGKSAQDKAEEWAKKINELTSKIDTDPLMDYNNAIQKITNSLEQNQEAEKGLTGGALQASLAKDVVLMKEKQNALLDLNKAQQGQADSLKSYLQQYGFYFDATGQLINSQQRLKEIEATTNAMAGNTEEEYNKKKEWVDWVKELQEKCKNYTDFVNSKIPGVTKQWQELGNTIRETARQQLQTLREDLVSSLKQDIQQEYDDKVEQEKTSYDMKKKNLEQEYEDEKENLENEKKHEEQNYQDDIDALKAQLDALNDDTADKKLKLAKYQSELAKWKLDDSVFAQQKIKELTQKISETEKDIQKDNLQNQIDAINKKKDTSSSYYEDELKDLEDNHKDELQELEDSNDEQVKATKKKYDKMLKDKELYAKADEMITKNEQDKMLKLLETYGESYKDVGSLLGENFKEGFLAQIQSAIGDFQALGGKLDSSINTGIPLIDNIANGAISFWDKLTGNSSSNSSSSSEVKVGDSVKVSGGSGDIVDVQNGSAVSKSGSWSSYSGYNLKTVGYDNGYFKVADENGNVIGWATRDDIARYDTGGRVPDNIGSDGKLAVLDAGEKVLTRDDTIMTSRIFDYVEKNVGVLNNVDSMLTQLNDANTLASSQNYSTPNLGNVSETSDNRNIHLENNIHVTNNTNDDSYFNARNLDRMWKQQISRFGGK